MFLSALILSISGFAGETVNVSRAVKVEVASVVSQRCDLSGLYDVEWMSVSARQVMEDQGVVDTYYTIHLDAIEGDGDQRPFYRTPIIVTVAEYAISNPSVKNIEVLSVKGSFCK